MDCLSEPDTLMLERGLYQLGWPYAHPNFTGRLKGLTVVMEEYRMFLALWTGTAVHSIQSEEEVLTSLKQRVRPYGRPSVTSEEAVLILQDIMMAAVEGRLSKVTAPGSVEYGIHDLTSGRMFCLLQHFRRGIFLIVFKLRRHLFLITFPHAKSYLILLLERLRAWVWGRRDVEDVMERYLLIGVTNMSSAYYYSGSLLIFGVGRLMSC